jgi:ribosome-associated protein
VILDMREVTYFTDYFIICSTDSERQSKAIAEELERTFKQEGIRKVGVSGHDGGQWILADFADIVCHIFLKSVRSFYDLESLWSEAPRVDFKPPRRRRSA